MPEVKSTSIRNVFTTVIGFLALSVIAACSGQAEASLEDYSLKTGWYKIEGQHKVTVFPDGEPEKTFEDFPIDSFACLTSEDVRRRSEEEIVQGMTAEGYDVLEVNVTPFKDSIKAVSPSNDYVRGSISHTVLEYTSDLAMMTVTIKGEGETDKGPLKLTTRTTNTWLSDDCPNH